MTAVAKALHRQNGWLRQNIELEAQHIAKLSAGKLQTRMAAYNAQLVAAVDSNTAALNELFGPPPAWTWPALPWRSDRNVDIYNGLGSVWRHLAKDWSAEGNAGVRALNSRVTSLIVDELQRTTDGRGSVLLPGCGTGRLAWEIARALPEAVVVGTEVSEAQLGVARYVCRRRARAPPDIAWPRDERRSHLVLSLSPTSLPPAATDARLRARAGADGVPVPGREPQQRVRSLAVGRARGARRRTRPGAAQPGARARARGRRRRRAVARAGGARRGGLRRGVPC